jgi:glycosyltransferase involved in cell wall biosynthesis
METLLGGPSEVRLSIIILARGESALLGSQLRALVWPADSQADKEILVVAVAGADRAERIVSAFQGSSHGCPIRFLRQPGSSAAQARNLGAAEARGSLLLFLDDLTEPVAELSTWHCERHQPQSVVLGYPVPVALRNPSLLAAREFLIRSDAYHERRSAGHRFQYREFTDSSMLLSSELFQRAGGFDPAAEPLEYAEFGLRLLKQGIRPFCIPEPVGRRHPETEGFSWWERTKAEAKASIRIGDRHPEIRPEFWWLTDTANRRARLLRNFAINGNKAVERVLKARLDGCETFRLRIRWPKAYKALWEYSYSAGVREALGAWNNLLNWLQDGPAPPTIAPDAPLLNVDNLNEHRGDQSIVKLDCEKGLRVAVRGVEIGAMAPLIGAEPLRYAHVSHWVEETLQNPASRLAAPVRDRWGYLPAAQFSVELKDLTRSLYVDPRYGRLDLLVCSEGRPLTSVSLSCESIDRVISPERLRLEVLLKGGWDVCRDAGLEPVDRVSKPEYPPVSVVVCTRDRPVSLRNCLQHLSRLSYPEFEVVVVDNASRCSEIEDIVVQSGFRYVRENRPGLDWALNRGLDEARYDIVAYTEDDACVSPGWLRAVARAFQDGEVSAMTGLVLPLELETWSQALFEEYGGMSRGLLPRVFDWSCASEFDITAAFPCGVGANMAFRREALEQIGRFDTALDVGTPSLGAGDLDIFHRIVASGRTLIYAPAAWIRHRHRRQMEGLEWQLYSNARSFSVYLIKVWTTRTASHNACIRVARWWLVRWLLMRLLRRLRRRRGFPLRLILAEIRGTLHGPWAYRQAYRRDRELRSAKEARTDVTDFEPARSRSDQDEPSQPYHGKCTSDGSVAIDERPG